MEISERIQLAQAKLERQSRLEWHEKQMTKAANDVAASLRDIHKHKLWQDKYASFEEYCQQRWGMTRQRAYQIIGAQNAREVMMEEAQKLGEVDLMEEIKAMPIRQLTPIVAVSEATPGKAVEIIKEAASQPGKLTAERIKNAKAKVLNEKPKAKTAPSKAKTCPHCGQPMS